MKLNIQQLNELCKIAEKAAIEAGEFIESSMNQFVKLENKKGLSEVAQIVTDVDFKSQEIILKHLKSTCSTYDLGLLTEELQDDSTRLVKDYFWIIDPLDGTFPYSNGDSGYAVSIALVSQNGESIIGVVLLPDVGDLYTSIKGQGVLKNNEPFELANNLGDQSLKVFSDHSLKSERSYDKTLIKLNQASVNLGMHNGFEIYFGYGAVVNAISVMNNLNACYFKYTKSEIGGGSVWDFAATNLFFKELDLVSTEFAGNEMDFNPKDSLFMNHCGILYANTKNIATEILKTGSLFQY